MVEHCDNAIDQGGWRTDWSIHCTNTGDNSRRRNKHFSFA